MEQNSPKFEHNMLLPKPQEKQEDETKQPQLSSKQKRSKGRVVIGSRSCRNQKSQHNNGFSRCKYCCALFDSPELLIIHLGYEHRIGMGKTQLASAFTKILSQYEFHHVLHKLTSDHNNIKVYCPTCENDFHVKFYFALHLIECFHRETFICPFCSLKKSCISDLNQHMNGHFSMLQPQSCAKCDLVFLNEWNLNTHKGRFHQDYVPPNKRARREVETTLQSVDAKCTISHPCDVINPTIAKPEQTTARSLSVVSEESKYNSSNNTVSSKEVAKEYQNVSTQLEKSKCFILLNKKSKNVEVLKKIPKIRSNSESSMKSKIHVNHTKNSEISEEYIKSCLINPKICKKTFKSPKKLKKPKQMTEVPQSPLPYSFCKAELLLESVALEPQPSQPVFEVLATGEVLFPPSLAATCTPHIKQAVPAIKEVEQERRRALKPHEKYNCSKCGQLIRGASYFDHLYSHIFKCHFCTKLICSKSSLDIHLGFKLQELSSLFEYTVDPSILAKYNPGYLYSGKDKRDCVYYLERKDQRDENICQVCRESFKFHCDLVRHHNRKFHDIDLYQCATCDRKFSTTQMFILHSRSHDTQHTRCQQCGKIYIDIHSFQRHLFSFHSPNTFGVKCYFCHAMKLNESKLSKHVAKHHESGCYSCTRCDISFAEKDCLEKHLRNKHGQVKYKCVSCNAQFSSIAFENQHQISCAQTRRLDLN